MLLKKPRFWDYKYISFLAIALSPVSFIVNIFNFMKLKKSKKKMFPIPIICIGNIYLGGTGKTPLAIELFKILKKINKRPAFVKKYYKNYIDEVKLLKKHGKVFTNNDRIVAINSLINNKKKIAILDDGLQENRIKFDLSIVCFNQKQWIGNGLLIPAGPLRENLKAIKKYNWVFINGKKNLNIERKIFSINSNIKIFYFKYKLLNIKKFKKNKMVAFAGIGNPNNFFDLLKEKKINIVKTFEFPDHYSYTQNDLIKLKQEAKNLNASLITTEKDYMRLNSFNRKKIKFFKTNLEITNKNKLIKELKKL